MTQQPGQEWPQENPYAAGAGQPPAYPQPGYAQPGYAQPGVPQAPAYAPPPQYPAYPAAGYGAAGYAPAVALPPLAHWGKRVLAMLIDGVVVLALVILGGVLMSAGMQQTGVDLYGDPVREPSAAGIVGLLLGYGAAFGYQVWNRWVLQGRTGQSVGKRVLGIRLLSERSLAPVGPGMAFARDLCHIADGFFYLGYLWPLWDAKRQTFADKIIGTVVVDG